MSDLVLNALRRNREIAETAGQFRRVERIDARLAELAQSERSAEKKANAEVDATPAAAELANAEGIDLTGVEGTGEGGRITKWDVEAAIKAAADEA
jgi:pyruvate/2-oxoglutarate dehydrogenase complex dihydrolipoamide acyltransferase (E2) component